MEGATDCKIILTGHASTRQGRLVRGCRVGVCLGGLPWLWGGDGNPTRGEAGSDHPEAVLGNQRPDHPATQRPDQRPDPAGSLAPLEVLLPPQGDTPSDSPWLPLEPPRYTRLAVRPRPPGRPGAAARAPPPTHPRRAR